MLRFIPRNAGGKPAPEGFCTGLGLSPIAAELLWRRGIRTEDEAEAFLNPELSRLHDPYLLPGIREAVDILCRAREERWPTVVYGDYDVDGICAASLLTLALRRWGLNAQPHVPLREEGYGLNAPAVEKLARKYRLLVTVDLGITNHEEVALAKSLGMTVIVTDHHTPDDQTSPADVAVNPLIGDYPFQRLCGTGVAFKLAQALPGLEDAYDFLDLAALATVADIVPLQGENRILVTHGLKAIEEAKRPGIAALLEVSRSSGTVSSDTLGFQLGPRLNSAGRLGDASLGVRLMMTDDPEEARAIAAELNDLNEQRKQKEDVIVRLAEKELREKQDFCRDKAIFLTGSDWLPGIMGLAAGKLTQKYACPSCVMTENGQGDYVGSLRSVPGVNIIGCLRAGCDGILKRYGGHEGAAGATVAMDRVDEFRAALQSEIVKAEDRCFIPSQEYDLEVPLASCSEELLSQLERLAPFGCGNPSPLLLLRGGHLEERRTVGANGAHLKTVIRDGSRCLSGIAFGAGEKCAALPDRVDTVFALERNTFRGVTSLQMSIAAIEPEAESLRRDASSLPEGKAADGLVRFLSALNERKLSPGEALPCGDSELRAALGENRRGDLFIARTAESAAMALSLNPELDLVLGKTTDLRLFPTLLVSPALPEGSGGWRRIFLLDGLLCPEEAAVWRLFAPRARLHAMPLSGAARALCRRVDPGLEGCRALYRRLKGCSSFASLCGECSLEPEQARLALLALKECDLIEYRESPFLAYPLPAGGTRKDLYASSPTLATVCGLK